MSDVIDIAYIKNNPFAVENVKTTRYIARQVTDFLPIQMLVTEHRAEEKTCPCCNTKSLAPFPVGVTHPVQYGRGIKGAGVYLKDYQMLSSSRTVEALMSLFKCDIAEGSLFNWAIEAAIHTVPSYEAIKEYVTKANVAHFDESMANHGIHRRYLHVACTPEATHLAPNVGRGREAMNEIGILPVFKGRAIHDMFSSYFTYEFKHGLCNAHIVRELTLSHEEYKQE